MQPQTNLVLIVALQKSAELCSRPEEGDRIERFQRGRERV